MTDSPRRRFVTTTVEVEGREEQRVVELPAFDVAPWDDDTVLDIVGSRATRVDAREKITGRARYTTDLAPRGVKHAVFVRAEWANGTVTHVEVEAAQAVPGVCAVITRAELAADVEAGLIGGAFATLFDHNVRYAGTPVAVVCADTLAAAQQAAALVQVQGHGRPHVINAAEALAPDAPRVPRTFDEASVSAQNLLGGAPVVLERGDVSHALTRADVRVDVTVHTPAALHSPLEPHGALAEWNGDQLTVWEGTQGLFRVRDNLAAAFRLPLNHVRVRMEHMGGGFGAKNYAGTHTYIAAWLARRLGAPVRCILDRDGTQVDTGHRSATTQVISIAANRDGTLTAIDLTATITMGVSGWLASPGQLYHELYACPNVRTHESFVHVHTGGMQAFRGPGYVEGCVGLELAMDALARALDMDRVALRLANIPQHDQRRERAYSGHRLRECFVEAERRMHQALAHDTSHRAADVAPLAAGTTSRLVRGIGYAAECWSTGGGPPAYATVQLLRDGSVQVLAGTQDLGTGARTILAQIAAQTLGARLECVRCVIGDTERTPYTGNSWGSMTTPSVGPAVRLAAEDVRRQLCDAAAGLLNTTPDELTIHDSVVHHAASGQSRDFTEIGRALGNIVLTGHGSRGPNPDDTTIVTVGVQAAEVEVDRGTGIVRVLRLIAVHDAGRIINPTLAEAQMEGGMLQGLGYALFEERRVDATLGVSLATGLHDYKMPTAADCPDMRVYFLDAADAAANSIGARGIAEPAIIPTAPAIANAVAHALGVPVYALPLTPWRVLEAIAKA